LPYNGNQVELEVFPLLALYFYGILTIVFLLILLLIFCTATPRLESELGLFTVQLAEGQLYCPPSPWDRVRGNPSEQLDSLLDTVLHGNPGQLNVNVSVKSSSTADDKAMGMQ
jgi:hypothetical protein